MDKKRRYEIIVAMNRYLDRNKRIPQEWLDELNEISERLEERI